MIESGSRRWDSEAKYYRGNFVFIHEGRSYEIEMREYKDPPHCFVKINGTKFHLHGEWYDHVRTL